jgi:hypothetical protein
MLSDDLAKMIADAWTTAVLTVSWCRLGREFLEFTCQLDRTASDLLDRADANPVCLAESPVHSACLSHSHLRATYAFGYIGGIGVSVTDEALARPRLEHCCFEHPAMPCGIRRREDWATVDA